MRQEFFNWTYLVLLVTIVVVRKVHEWKSGRCTRFKGTPIIEMVLIVLWGLAAGVFPLFYIFGTWLNFADLPFSVPSAFYFVGTAFFMISIWLLHRSHADLGESWSPIIECASHQQLVTDGVYKRIRHPIYGAHVLWGIAQALLLPNLIAGQLALVLVLAVMALRIPREEQTMLDRFGDEYRQYMNTSGRILPKIGIWDIKQGCPLIF
jgi:protein-S-isoprenylcysteine O-methyltransferase Ste14